MNNILVHRIEKFIGLNPEMVDAVLLKYGVDIDELPLNVKTVVDTFKIYGKPFAQDIYEALRPEIEAAKNVSLSNTDGEVDTTVDPSLDSQPSAWDWTAFWNGITGLAGATPGIITAANGQTYPYGTPGAVNVPGYYPPPTTSSINILMYVAIAVFILVALLIAFKSSGAKA